MRVPLQTFLDVFKDSHGPEGAEKLLQEVVHRLGLEGKMELTKDEAILLCEEMKEKPGFVGIAAGILLTRIAKG